MSFDEGMEMSWNSDVFITNRKVVELLHLMCLLSVAKNVRISVVILEEYHKPNTAFNSGFNTDFN